MWYIQCDRILAKATFFGPRRRRFLKEEEKRHRTNIILSFTSSVLTREKINGEHRNRLFIQEMLIVATLTSVKVMVAIKSVGKKSHDRNMTEFLCLCCRCLKTVSLKTSTYIDLLRNYIRVSTAGNSIA